MTHMNGELASPANSKLIVEIGAGRHDMAGRWQSLPYSRTFAPDEMYLGFDIGDEHLDIADGANPVEAMVNDQRMRIGWTALQAAYPDQNIHFVQADGRHLPLPDRSVDQVVGVNVLGYGAIGDPAIVDIIRESKRVLKTDGEIVFHDFVTPRWTDRFGLGMWLKDQPDAPRLTTRLIHPQSPNDWYTEALGKYGLRDTRHEFANEAVDGTIWIMKHPESWPFPSRPLQ